MTVNYGPYGSSLRDLPRGYAAPAGTGGKRRSEAREHPLATH
jgi:hypothetical protein